jgi:hypothetical protein
MTLGRRTLLPLTPVAILLVTSGLGWMLFVRPLSADRARAGAQLESLRQRELALRRELSAPAPGAGAVNPVAAFEQRVSAGDASAALLEQLARLASAARARNLLIETIEGSAASPASPAQPLQRDPRFALFEVPVSHVPIRIAFDADYASIGRFLWAFRNLPTTAEIRSLTVRVPPADPGDEEPRRDGLRVSLTLHAYSRQIRAVIQASSTVTQ